MKFKEKITKYIESLKFSRLTLYDDNMHFVQEFNRLNARYGELMRDYKKLEEEHQFFKRGYFRVLRRNERARKYATSKQTNFNKTLVTKVLDILNGSRDN